MEEYLRYVHVKLSRSKGEASDTLLEFLKFFEKQTGHKIRKVHTNGGGEFTRARKELKAKGLTFTHTSAYTPHSNGLVERTHKTITSIARANLLQAKLPHKYWDYAVQHAAESKHVILQTTTDRVSHEVVHDGP